MIVRNLTLKVQGNRTCTDSPIYLYQNDRNIHLVITLNNVKYEVTRDMYVSFTIVKPNGDTLDLTNGFLKDGKVHLILESELFDGDEEVGNALCQIKLYDNQRLSSISLPPFAIHVLKDNGNPIINNDKDVLLSQDELKLLTENELALSIERKIKISELPTTTEASGYVPVVQNDKTMRYNLDGLATKQFVQENLNETLNEVTEQMDIVNQMAVSLEGKADADDVEWLKQSMGSVVHISDINNMIKEPVLNDAKSYTNGQVQEGIHSATTQANSYTDTKLQEAKTYTDDAIANLDLSGAGGSGSGLDVRVIGGENTQGYDWYEFTGSEFTIEEFKANAKMLVLFDNVAFSYGSVKVDGLAQVSLCVATEHDYMGNGQIDRMLEVLIDTFEKRYTVYINEQVSDDVVYSRYISIGGEHARVLENQLSSYATTQYVDDAIANIDTGGSGNGNVDLSGYVTTTQLTTELNKKSDTTHTHDDRYGSTYLGHNPIDSMNEVQDIYLSANCRHYDVREESYFESIRIVLPTNLTTRYVYEYHIYFNPTEFSDNTYKKNIFVTGGTVKWQQGTSLEIDSQHIYEIILTYVGGVISSSRYWLGGVVVYG